MLGTVKFYNPEKSFGFVKPDEGQKDVFIHRSALQKGNIMHLPEGARIAFDIEHTDRGQNAINVVLVA